MSKIKKLQRPVDQDLVDLLNQAMEMVLKGEVLGIVLLTNNVAKEYNYSAAGDMSMSEVTNAFESWAFDQRMRAWQELNKK